jgi:hypothetical protein
LYLPVILGLAKGIPYIWGYFLKDYFSTHCE